MNQYFIKKFIEKELYIQNPPILTKKFIDLCDDRGIETSKEELEYLEKEKLLYPILRIKNEKIEYDEYQSISFNDTPNNILISLLNDKKILSPKELGFIPFSELGEKISSYYSNFQIIWLKKIKETVNCENWKELLKNEKRIFDERIELFLLIQLYYPFVRSNNREININLGFDEDYNSTKWYEKIEEFNLDDVLEYTNLDIDYMVERYRNLSKNATEYLGNSEGIQLYKNISYKQKRKLKGNIRLGIDYLEWALMIKKCIENHIGREIFDVDECLDYSSKNILKLGVNNAPPQTLRDIRNKIYYNKLTKKSEYDDIYKRLFYMSNDFNLGYHPRMILFVEGKTELEILPKFFEFIIKKPENLGIDIINIGGISNFYSPTLNIKNENKKYTKTVISNYKNLINYVLNKYQTIPFFVGDNENNVCDSLKKGELFEIDEKNAPIPEKWYYIWKNDFEFDNFTDKEIFDAIKENIDIKFNLEDVKIARNTKRGIKSIDSKISAPGIKIKIAHCLLKNLKTNLNEENAEEVSNRPIFKCINKILDIVLTNHPPISTLLANKNKNILEDMIFN